MNVFGVRFVGLNAETGRKLLFSLVLVVVVLALRVAITATAHALLHGRGTRAERGRFWTRQTAALVALVVLVVGLASIWFDDPARLATVVELVSAGVAIALQRVVTAFAL